MTDSGRSVELDSYVTDDELRNALEHAEVEKDPALTEDHFRSRARSRMVAVSLQEKPMAGDGTKHGLVLWLVFFVSLAIIGAGIVALVLKATGTTQLHVAWFDMNTGNAGVACVGVGAVAFVMIAKAVLKS